MRLRHLLGSLAAMLTLGGWGCGPAPSSGGNSEIGVMTTPVVVASVERHSVTESLSLVGTVEANEMVEIKAETVGFVNEILFEEGQDVAAGQVLIRLDQEKLKASYDQAVANLKLSESELERNERLFSGELVSRQEYDQAATRAESDRALVELRRQLWGDSEIIAPFSGVVGARNVSPGQVISLNQTLTWLVDLDPVRVRFFVPERFLGVAKKGLKVSIAVASYPKRRFEGEVYFVAPFVDPTTRNVEVKAMIPNQERLLIPGMFANLELTVTIRDHALVIPEMAVFRTLGQNKAVVYVVGDDMIAETRTISIGERMPGRIEILEGLSEGERVIVEGTQKIGPGSSVTVSSEYKPQSAR